MINELEQEEAILNRISNKELYIKKIINRYLDLGNLSDDDANKLNIIEEIEEELNSFEIQILKSKNIYNTAEEDLNNQKKVENIITIELEKLLEKVNHNKTYLELQLKTRSNIIECEDLAKEVNCLSSKTELIEEIDKYSKINEKLENEVVEKTQKMKQKSEKLNLLISLLNELKSEE